jgi:hypothetical protein
MIFSSSGAKQNANSRPARTKGVVAAVVEVLLGIFALVGGVVHLLFGIGGLVT